MDDYFQFGFNITNDSEWCKINKLHYENSIALDAMIYHYVELQHLLKMLKTGLFAVTNRSCFSDLLDAKGLHKNVRYNFDCFVEAHACSDEIKQQLHFSNERKRLLYSAYISCWTFDRHDKVDESVLMWKAYNRECRIKTSIEKLVRYASNADNESLLSVVNYKSDDGFLISDKDRLFTKLSYYEDEQELRLCFTPDTLSNNVGDVYSFCIKPEDLIIEILFSPFLSKERYEYYKKSLISDFPWLKNRIRKSAIIERC